MTHSFKENLMTTKDASELSGYTSDYLARLVRSGEIQGKRIGHNWVIDSASLEAFMTKQQGRKLDRARELASSRVREYNKHNQFVRRTTRALTEKISIPQFDFGQAALRAHVHAFGIAVMVVALGAVGAHAAAVPQVVARASALATEISSGFVDTFGIVPSRIAARMEEARTAVRADATRDVLASRRAGYVASPVLAAIDLETLRSVLVREYRAPRTASGIASSPSRADAPILTAADVHVSAAAAYAFLAHPASIGAALADAYFTIGTDAYAAVDALFSAYRARIDDSGVAALALAATTRDTLARAPHAVAQVNLALGEAVVNATHAAIRTDVIVAHGFATAAPESARIAVTLMGSAGDTLARAAEQVPARVATAYLNATAVPAVLAPRLAQAIFGAEYAVASRFVSVTSAVSERYLALVEGTGSLAYESSSATRSVARSVSRAVAFAPAAIEDATLGALGKSAVALDSVTHLSSFAAVLPALSASEKTALAVYEAIHSVFDSANRSLVAFFSTTPETVLPTGVPKARVIAVATSTRPVASGTQPVTTLSYPTYTTVVRGVSEDFMNQSLASLRTNVLATVASMIQPVSSQVVQNITTIQQLNRIDSLHDLVVENGDFRNSIFDSGIRVSATDGYFSKLSAGTTTLATTTVNGTLTISSLTLTGSLSSPGSITGSHFVSTSTNATSTFAGSINIDNAGFVYATSTRNVGIGVLSPAALLAVQNSTSTQPIFVASNAAGAEVYRLTNDGFVGIGTTSPTYNLAVEGSSSLGNQAIAGYFTATTSTATSTFAGGLAVGTGKLVVDSTTGNIGIGTTSPYQRLSVAGNVIADTFIATSTSGTSTFAGALAVSGLSSFTLASTSRLSVFDYAWFGGSATSTFTSNGYLGILNDSPLYPLDVTGIGRFSSLVDASHFVATSTSATSTFAGGLAVGTSRLLVDSTTGRVGIGTTSPSGTLAVSGDFFLTGSTTITGAGSGITFTGSGNHDITASGGTLRIGTNTIIGNIEALDDTVDIGTAITRFDKIYANEVNASTIVGTLTGGNLSAETFTINSDNATADTESSYLVFERGTITPNASLSWNAAESAKRFEFNHPLFIQNASASTTLTTLDLKSVAGQIADIFRVASSSSDTLFNVTASGNVGIGTTTPFSRLSVTGAGTGTGRGFSVADSSNVDNFYVLDNGNAYVKGNLGIGTTTPSDKLSVFTSTGNAGQTIETQQANSISFLQLKNSGASGRAYSVNVGGNTSSWPSSFFVYDNTALQTRLLIDTSGSVGIGTTTPAYKLSVEGSSSLGNQAVAGYFTATTSTATSTFAGGLAVETSGLVYDYSSNNVGIGTAAPTYKLALVGDGSFLGSSININDGSSRQLTLRGPSAAGSSFIGTASAHSLLFGTNATNYLSLSSAGGLSFGSTYYTTNPGINNAIFEGNVGIGTTSPQTKLEILSSGTGNTANDPVGVVANFVSPTQTGEGSTISLASNDAMAADKGGVLGFGGRVNTGASLQDNWAAIKGLKADAISGNYGGYLSFWTRLTGNASAERMRIDTNGNVGIGTTTPSTTLSVQGNGLFSGNLTAANITATGTLSVAGALSVTGNVTQTGGAIIAQNGAITGNGALLIGADVTASTLTDATRKIGVVSTPHYTNAQSKMLDFWSDSDATTNTITIGGGLAGFHAATNVNIYAAATNTGGAGASVAAFTSAGAAITGTLSATATTTSTGGIVGPNNFVVQQSSGKVGIGTATPGQKLTVQDTASAPYLSLISGDTALNGILFGKVSNTIAGQIIYSNSTNAMSFVTNTATAMTISSVGNVGIGTTTPWGKLSVTNTGTGPSFVVEDATSPDTTPFIVDASGNVGVGIASPSHKLQIVGSNNATEIKVSSTDQGSGAILFGDGASALKNVGIWRGNANSYAVNGNWMNFGTYGDGGFVWATGNAELGSQTERMRIVASTGNVGIGTTSPAQLLSIGGSLFVGASAAGGTSGGLGVGVVNTTAGTLQTSGSATIGGTIIGSGVVSAATEYRLNNATFTRVATMDSAGGFGGGYNFNWNNINPGHDSLGALSGYGYTGGTVRFYTDSSQVAGTGAPERLRIGASGGVSIGSTYVTTDPGSGSMIVSGNVGIGTTSPTQKLSVEGDVLIKGDDGWNGAGDEANLQFGDNTNYYWKNIYGSRSQLKSWSGFDIYGNSGLIMSIQDGGNVGIGTTSPNQKLSIFASAADSAIEFSSLTSDPYKWTIGQDYSDGGKFKISSSTALGTNDRFVIDGNGSVGIGTTSPSTTLAVQGNGLFSGNLTAANITATGTLTVAGATAVNGNTTLGDASTDTVTINGYVGVNVTPDARQLFQVSGLSTGGVTGNGVLSAPTFSTAVTSGARALYGAITTSAASYTLAAGYGAYIANATKGAGSTITDLYGVYVADQTQGTNNYGITSLVSAGTNKYNIYASGTAQNYFAGNVGIGTTLPLSKLGVLGSASVGATYGAIAAPTSGMIIEGNVGIGTTSPAATLQISSTIGTSPTNQLVPHMILDSRATAGVGVGPSLVFKGQSGNSNSPFYSFAAIQGAKQSVTADDYGGYLSFHTQNTSGASAITERMRIDSGGNVGIGTTSPWGKLSVTGAGATSATYGLVVADSNNSPKFVVRNDGNVGIGTTSPAYKLSIRPANNNADGLTFDQTAGYPASIIYEGTGGSSSGWGLTFKMPTGASTQTSVLALRGNGNVGIGTTSPWGQLSVNPNGITGPAFVVGSSTATNFIVTNGGNVGIGTASPAAKLEILSTGTQQRISYDASNSADFSVSSGGNLAVVATGGRYGFGTVSPTANFDFQAAIGSQKITATTGSNASYTDYVNTGGTVRIGNERSTGTGLLAGTSAYDGVLTVQSAHNLHFGTNSLIRATIDSSGNVGIGTTAPGFQLHLAKDGAASVEVISTAYTSSDGSILGFRKSRGTHAAPTVVAVNDIVGEIDFNAYNDAFRTMAMIKGEVETGVGATGADMPGRLTFWTTPDGSATPLERLTIKESGNVGIGTTSPVSKLSVLGESAFAGGASVGIGYAGTAAPTGGMIIQGNVGIGTTSPVAKLEIATPSSGSAFIANLIDNTAGGFVVQQGSNKYLDVTTANTNETVTIGNTTTNPETHILGGNVGIGTTTPNAKLVVAGSNSGYTTSKLINSDLVNGGELFTLAENDSGGTPFYIERWNSSHATLANQTTISNTGNLLFRVNAAERMRIDTTGNVGIGTTAPGEKLDIQGASYTTFPNNPSLVRINSTDALATNMGGGIHFGGVYTGTTQTEWAYIGGLKENATDGNFAGRLVFGTRTAGAGAVDMTRMVIDSTGNVGIGTTTPDALLNVSANTAGDIFQLKLNNQDASGGAGISIQRNNSIRAAQIAFGLNGTNEWYVGELRRGGGGVLGFSIGTGADTGATTPYFHILQSNGNVGIGTTTPFSRLSVTGAGTGTGRGLSVANSSNVDNFYVLDNGNAYMKGNVGIGTTAPGNKLSIVDSTALYSAVKILNSSATGKGLIISGGADSTNYNTQFRSYNDTTVLMQISGDGNVGIGTTSPWGQLSVNPNGITGPAFVIGSSTATNFIVTNGGNVGVGTASPGSLLTVSGTTNDGIALLASSQLGTGRALELNRSAGSATRPVASISQNSATGGSQAALLIRQADTGEVALGINTDGSLTAFNFKVLDTGAVTAASLATPSIITASGALGITPAAGSGVNVNLSTTGDFAVNTDDLYVDTSTGNVGIGTTNPATGTAAGKVVHLSSAGNGPEFRMENTNSASDFSFIATSAGRFGLYDNDDAAYRWFVDTSGNVGIGTTVPGSRLSVGTNAEDAGFATPFEVWGSNASTTAATILKFGMPQVSGVSYAVQGAFNMKKWETSGTNARSQLDILLTHGATNTVDTTVMSLQSGGNVGIGTTSPVRQLHVNANSTTGGIVLTNTTTGSLVTDGFQLQQVGNATHLINEENDVMAFWTNAAQRMTISSTGNVGIGTTSPGAKLDVTDNTIGDSNVYAQFGPTTIDASTRAGGIKLFASATSDSTWGIFNDTNGPAGLTFEYLGARSTSHLAGTNVMTLLQSGNVGIGTTSPFSRLSVTGAGTGTGRGFSVADSSNVDNFYVLDNGNAYMKGNVGIGTTGPDGKLHVMSGSAGTVTANAVTDELTVEGSADAGMHILTPDANVGRIMFGSPSDDSGAQIGWDYTNSLMWIGPQKTGAAFDLRTGNQASAIRIDSTGNVGIGTTLPDTKLHLAGTGAAPAYLTWERTDGAVGSKDWIAGVGNQHQWLLGKADDSGTLTNQYVTVLTTGNVGIGTTSPFSRLSVTGAGTGTGRGFSVADSSNVDNFYVLDNGNAYMKGNVGIGTTSPQAKLDIYGGDVLLSNDRAYAIEKANGTDQNVLRLNTTNELLVSSGGGNLEFWDGSSQLVTIENTSGNVGIGTTAPGNPLTITAGNKAGFNIQYDNSGGARTGLFAWTTGSSIAGLGGGVEQTTDNVYTARSTAGSFMRFTGGETIIYGNTGLTAGNTFTPTARVKIDTNGNVGIGTTSPFSRLSVTGAGTGTGRGFSVADSSNVDNFYVLDNGNAYMKGNVGIGTTSPMGLLSLSGGTAASVSNPIIDLINNRIINWRGSSGGVSDAGFLWYDSSNNLKLGTNNGTKVTISSTGNVGIGTTSPLYKLTVLPSSGDGIVLRESDDGNNAVRLLGYAGNGFIDVLSGGTSVIAFNGGGNSYINTGNVGIGTTTPAYKLDIAGFINTDQYSGYKQAGNTILYASTTNNTLAVGASEAAGWMSATTTQRYSVAVGPGALAATPTNVTAQYNTAVGYLSLTSNTTGVYNTANGALSLSINNTGFYNTATGYRALFSNTTGYSNTATGRDALSSNTTGYNNTANGVQALFYNQFATTTTALGAYAARGLALYGNQGGVYLGYQSGYNASTGSDYNTFLGYQSGYGVTTGSNNIWIGTATSSTAIANLTTGSQNILIGNNISLPSATASGQLNLGNIIFGTGITGTGSTLSTGNIGIGTTSPATLFEVGGSTANVTFDGYLNCTGFTSNANGLLACTASDERLKQDVVALDGTSALAGLNALNPVSFYWNPAADRGSAQQYGLIAQQVQTVFPNLVATSSPTALTPDGTLSVNYEGLISPMVMAIQELDTRTTFISNAATSTVLTVNAAGNVGIGTTTPNHTLSVAGDIGAIAFVNTSTRSAKTDIDYATASSSEDRLSQLVNLKVATYRYTIEDQNDPLRLGLIAEDTQAIAPEILSADGKGVDIYELATFTLSGVQALAAKVDAQETRMASLEDRINALESGAISSASGSPLALSSSTLASALEGFGVLIRNGIAQFNTLVFRQLVASRDADGTSSAGSVTIIGGNTIAQVTNSLVQPSTKVFVTFNSSVTGSWWVSDKTNGSFRVVLSEAQPGDVSFDYFLVQTEGQIATSTPATANSTQSTGTTSGTDTTAPVITLLGDNPLHLSVGGTFVEPGVTVTDNADASVPYITFVNGIEMEATAESIGTSVQTTYIITYSATDARGNLATATRSVIVGSETAAPSDTTIPDDTSATTTPASTDATAPVVSLTGGAALELTVGDTFTDPGATATDDTDGDVTSSIAVSGTVDTATEGLYTLTYTATDAAGNAGSASRVVTVVAAPAPAPEPAPAPAP